MSSPPLTAEIMSEVDPEKPGVNPQPWTGIQYVSIPEFQDVGNQVSQEVVDAIAGRQTVDQALEAGQEIAQRAGEATEGGLMATTTTETRPHGLGSRRGPETGHG